MAVQDNESPAYLVSGTPAYRRASRILFVAGFSTFATLYCVQPILGCFAAFQGLISVLWSNGNGSDSVAAAAAVRSIALLLSRPVMEKEYFVDDYEKLVAALKSVDPIDVAMSKAVGGAYEIFGHIECQVLEQHGLANGMSVLDFGCGSGRLSTALSQKWGVEYLGVDVVDDLLRFAASKAPPHYRFLLNHGLSIPVSDAFADICCAFSVFTHLRHEDSFLYLMDLVRAAKPGGRIIFSFLEFADPNHWTIFTDTVAARRQSVLPHLNVFIERNAISRWAAHLGCPQVAFVDSHDPRWGGHALGQSVAVLTKPAA